MDKIFKKVADQFGITPEQVKEEIDFMIRDTMKRRNETPKSRALWDELSPNGEIPSAELFILFVTAKAQQKFEQEKKNFS